MFRKKIINASSNSKKDLHVGTKIKSDECLNIGTNRVLDGDYKLNYNNNYDKELKINNVC